MSRADQEGDKCRPCWGRGRTPCSLPSANPLVNCFTYLHLATHVPSVSRTSPNQTTISYARGLPHCSHAETVPVISCDPVGAPQLDWKHLEGWCPHRVNRSTWGRAAPKDRCREGQTHQLREESLAVRCPPDVKRNRKKHRRHLPELVRG